jgi:glycosyltransferase involved in cell wall biosynthesis
MTVAEAMSCGLPVVVTNSGGVRWIVDDDGGLRVPERSPEDLARALSELISDPTRRQTMGAHNRARALKLFTWERVIDQLEQIYTQSLRIRTGADLGEVLDPGRFSNDASQEVSAYE